MIITKELLQSVFKSKIISFDYIDYDSFFAPLPVEVKYTQHYDETIRINLGKGKKVVHIVSEGEDGDFYIDLDIITKKILEKNNYRYISKYNRFKVLSRQKWNCNICSCKLKYSIDNKWDGEVAHIDHIYPFSKRESYPRGIELINELSNLQALCPQCNLTKASKEIN